ncbi:MAG TPA: ComEC family competence protein [Alphaproteobacteria bacterium]|nr:ComEC family competence protein [Alphaproteobacteria bacterium]
MSLVADIAERAARARRPPPPREPATPVHRPRLVERPRSGTLARAVVRALDERRLFVLLPFAVIAGLVTSLAGSSNPDPLALGTVGAVLAVAMPLAMRSLVLLRLVVLGAFFWLGFSLLVIHGALSGTPMLARPAYGTFEMRVDEIVSESESGRRVIVSAIQPLDDARPLPVRRARIVVADGPDLAPGDVIRGPVRFYAVPGPVVPGGFDTQFHAYFEGIGAYGAATRAMELVSAAAGATPEHLIDTVRRGIAERIDKALAQPAAGIARALITGDQSAVADGPRETLATAGLAHVLSVSGLHLTVVAGGVFAALRLVLSFFTGLGRFVSVKRLAAGGGILAALLYFAISGGNVAALRATIMIVLVFGAVIVGRRALTMRNVAIAALLVLLTDPAAAFRPSFQLSFAAVTALIGAWELARRREGRERNLWQQFLGYVAGIAITSFVAGAATLLFSIYHFQQTSPLGIVGNLASLPLVSFVMMPSAVLASLLMPFGFEAPFLGAMGWSIDRMLDVAGVVAAWSTAFDASPLLTPLALLLGLGALAWFAFLPTWHRLIAPVLLVPAVALFALDRPPDVLIADTTQAVALRLDPGLRIVTGKADSFAVDVWRETYGEPLEEGTIACDSIACIAGSPRGFQVAIVKDQAGFYEECAVDLVITHRRAPRACAAGTVIDADDLASGGVHWLAWDAGRRRFEVRRAIADRGRPWRAAILPR